MYIPFLSNLLRNRDKPQYYYIGTDFRYLFGPSTCGKNVNEFTAMQTTAVYACVRILAETLAAMPLTSCTVTRLLARSGSMTIRCTICFMMSRTRR